VISGVVFVMMLSPWCKGCVVMGLTLTQKLSITLSLLCTMNHNKIVILPVTLVELSSYSLYVDLLL